MTTAQFSPSGVFLRQSTTSGNRNLQIQGTAGADVGIYALGSGSGFGFQIYGDGGSNYGFLASLWGIWDIRKNLGGNLFLNNQSTYYVGTDTTYMLRVYGTADIRTPTYYDLDNTGYYIDIAATSNVNKVYYNSNMVSQNYGIGQVGLYDSYRYQAVFSMGEAYILPANGATTGTLYGIAWSHPNAGGAAANLASHGFLILENGTYRGSWGGASIRNPGDIRGTIFYDYDNTGYYVDPNNSSLLNTIFTNALSSYGNVTAFYSSDIKFKENVRGIPDALETVEAIGGKLFDWTDEYVEDHGGEDGYFMQKNDFGVIAQDVQKVFPIAVRTRPDGSLAVDYEKLSALAFAAVAELSIRVKSLEART